LNYSKIDPPRASREASAGGAWPERNLLKMKCRSCPAGAAMAPATRTGAL